jgi:glutaredoxin
MPRLLLVIGVLAAAGLVGYLSNRRRPQHPPLTVAGLGLPPGLVVFTSAECRRCKDVLAVAKSVGVPLREVTYELESDLQKRVGVTGVPLTLVIDRSGEVVAQLAGRLRMASLVRAVARAGF